jgi:homoserine kinase type II
VSAVTQLDLLHLEAVVRDYDIGELIRYWPAVTGIENSNYFLATIKAGVERHYVLTLLERAANAGDALVPLLDTCVSAGLPVPAVLRNRGGDAFTELDGRAAMVCPRLPGRHVYNPTQRQVEALGRFIAHFHRATLAAGLNLPTYPRDLDWLQRNAAACRGHLPYRAGVLMADVRDQLRYALARQDVSALPRGPIHADLFRDNVLFNEWGLAGVLDFHHASHGYLVYDLAVAANDWCTESNGALDPERTLALLRAYHAIRPIRREELWHFPVFALYAALAFWTSRLGVALEQRRGHAVRANNPDEFQRIVEHHQAHFFYLDERRLEVG